MTCPRSCAVTGEPGQDLFLSNLPSPCHHLASCSVLWWRKWRFGEVSDLPKGKKQDLNPEPFFFPLSHANWFYDLESHLTSLVLRCTILNSGIWLEKSLRSRPPLIFRFEIDPVLFFKCLKILKISSSAGNMSTWHNI